VGPVHGSYLIACVDISGVGSAACTATSILRVLLLLSLSRLLAVTVVLLFLHTVFTHLV
jgi:hypothetical protein